MKRVVVGLSGGVDSSVAAHLIKQQGYETIAVFMKNWHDTTGLRSAECTNDEDVTIARMVARKLDIPFHTVDLSEQYRKRVVDYMFREYENGRTPNPDVLCNREIKFDEFLKVAESYNADYVATGHYCRHEELSAGENTVHRLLAGSDPKKDQSYFLCQLSQEQLSRALFPIGDIHKAEVRQIAARLELASAERKDSQGICFVGKVDLPTFLQQQLAAKEGDIIEIPESYYQQFIRNTDDLDTVTAPYTYHPEDGQKVGTHRGAHFFTIGQRKGLNVGGKAQPLFVIATDTQRNIVYTGQGHQHQGLNRRGLFIPASEVHWLRSDQKMKIGETRPYLVRIRYRQPLQKARLYLEEKGLYVVFDELQRGITAGQFAAWYNANELIGSGVIA